MVFLLLVFLILIYGFGEGYVKGKFGKAANEELQPFSELVIQDLTFELFPLSVTVTDISIESVDSDENRTPDSPVHAIKNLSIEEFWVSGIGLWDILVNGNYTAGEIALRNSDLHLIPGRIEEAGSGGGQSGNDLLVEINNLNIEDLTVSLFQDTSTTAQTTIEDIDVNLSNLLYQSEITSIGQLADAMELSAGSFLHKTSSGFYEIEAKNIKADPISGTISVESSRLNPLYSPHTLPQQLGHEVDHIEVDSGPVHITGWKPDEWLNSQIVSVEKVNLDGLQIHVARDKNFPDSPDEEKPLLPVKFANLSVSAQIDSVIWRNGEIRYREWKEGQGTYGDILFASVGIDVIGLQNIDRDKTIRIDATTEFMERSLLTVNFEFWLNEAGTQAVSGELQQMNLPDLNSALEPLALARIEEGTLHFLNFQFQADHSESVGEVRAAYNNFSMQLLNEESLEETTWQNISSLFMNEVVLRSNKGEDDPMVGEIQFERETGQSMFNYWWKSLRSGLMSGIRRI